MLGNPFALEVAFSDVPPCRARLGVPIRTRPSFIALASTLSGTFAHVGTSLPGEATPHSSTPNRSTFMSAMKTIDNPLAFWIGIGVAIGAGIGVAIGNIAIGAGIGVAFGVAIGAIQQRKRTGKPDATP